MKHFYMGAVNKKTNEYVFPLHALKTDDYKCPICETDIIFKSGKKRRKHYSHKSKSNCSYYDNPSESEIHKDGKRLIKKMLDDKEKLMIWRNCKCCGDDVEVLTLINYTDKMVCREEFTFKHNSNNRNECGEIEIECVRDILCCECENKHKIKYEVKQKKEREQKLIDDEVKRIQRDKDRKMWEEWEENNRYKYDKSFKRIISI